MNLKDLAQKAIDEVNTEIEEVVSTGQSRKLEEKIRTENEAEVIDFSEFEKQMNEAISSDVQTPAPIVEENSEENDTPFNEEIFLKNIRERILVLFEGLNSIKKSDLESRLDLTINFLEFLLANIEDKLKK